MNQPSASESRLNIEQIRLTITDIHDPENLRKNYESFRQELEILIGVPVEFLVVNNPIEAASALRLNQVDIALAGPSEYVVITSRTNAVPLVGITRPNYYSIIATKTPNNINNLSNLKGKAIALSDIGSTSGHLGPMKLLMDAGLNPASDVEILMLRDEGSIQALKQGKVAAWGGSAVDYATFLNSQENFPILAQTVSLPSDILMVSSQIDPETVAGIRALITSNAESLITALAQGEATQKYRGSKLVEVRDSDYDFIRQVYQQIGEGNLIKQ
ncbi:MAG: PhnD/SsuA/transferrin family substrate-binding protein [Arthrospira sp. SH-MAG29]|nr:PhnD/SsuA/transferrin family substrate-binding protein [Arthrospira sp. SH-MAG29]MBS0015113.1 PhnD/SsuA/transferrin family substrate-binding protein [Arthrospira sp. SH-MAG29]